MNFPDGTPMFKLEGMKTAPDNKFERVLKRPKKSAWLDAADDDEDHCPSLLGDTAFGHWSVEKRFAYAREWRVLTEETGPSGSPGDDYQARMAAEVAENGGGVIVGRGGSGKSHLLKKHLRDEFIKRGFKESRIHVIAFTHVAAQNCEGETILHELHAKILSTK
jgi:hypothetical protein